MPEFKFHHGIGFTAHVMMLCRCGWLMQDSEGGTYCVNPECDLKTRLYNISVGVEEVPVPKGAAA
jgi:hypothetical protein